LPFASLIAFTGSGQLLPVVAAARKLAAVVNILFSGRKKENPYSDQNTNDPGAHPHSLENRTFLKSLTNTHFRSGQLTRKKEADASPRHQTARKQRANLKNAAQKKASQAQD
jgi:hypothetical protein